MARVLLTAALAAGALLPPVVFAESSSVDQAADSGTSSPSPIEVAQSSYPVCALKCLGKLVPQSDCELTDVACLCTNEPLNANISVCVTHGCGLEDQLSTKNVSMTMCGAPVRDRTHVASTIGYVGGSIALVTFLIRMFVCSSWMGRSIGLEDWAIAAGVALTVPPTVFAKYLGENGLGKDIWTLPLENIENVLFYYYLGELFYVAAQTMIKVSLLFFLLRVFPEPKFRLASWIIIGCCFAYGITFFMVTLFQCWPINYTWFRVDETKSGRCNNEHIQGWVAAACNILLDFAILILPLKQLWLLQMSMKKKALTMCMFSLGIFDIFISVYRLRSLITFANASNITWDYLEAAYWSVLELDVGIITACLPSVRIFFMKIGVRALATTNAASTKGSSSRGNESSSRATGLDSKRATPAPRYGDEGDFIPLVDVEAGKDKTASRGAESTTAQSGIRVHTEATHYDSTASEEDNYGYKGRQGRHPL